jgi:hypothetical protein
MSLINDALRRAKQATPPPPPAATSQFRPVDPPQPSHRSMALMLPAALLICTLLGLVICWQLSQGRTSPLRPQLVQARTPLPAKVAEPFADVTVPFLPAAPAPTAPAPAPVPAPPPARPEPVALPPTPPPPVAVLTSPTPPPTVEAPPETVATNTPPPAEVVQAKPPPLKLQGIVFDPSRPSVVINGQTLFIGERLGEFQVVVITPRSATVVSSAATNVLALGR